LKPDIHELKYIQIAPYIVFFKDWRDDVRRFHAYRWSFIFDALALKFNIPRDDIGYLSIDEIEQAIQKGTIDREVINTRKKGCVVTIAEKGVTMQVLNDVPKKYSEIALEVQEREHDKIIKGKTAQPGIVKGVVRIIRSHHDIKRVHEGDILVANTTHPNYLPAMQKAAAFVTNEGGIISHAAIVARELKKPCIVGTGNATKLLMDGDFVEVDATQGIIKILKKLK